MPDVHPARTPPRPVDLPMVPFALAGMAGWALVGLLMVVLDAPTGWRWICLAGFLLGIPGLLAMLVHDRNRARRRGDGSG